MNNENSCTLTKKYINDLKIQGGSAFTTLVEKYYNNSKNLVFILENLGHLSSSFDAGWLVDLLSHSNDNVRFWAVKNFIISHYLIKVRWYNERRCLQLAD